MVSQGTDTIAVPPAALLEALSQAFTYPWNGLDKTLAALRALENESLLPVKSDSLFEAAETFADDTAAQLAYTRLFIGSFKMEAPPYASFYLGEDQTLNGRAAAEVEAVYAQFGLELDADEKAPVDHLRYLLAFLALLAGRWEATGETAFAEAYADFRDEYVLSWIDRCSALVDRYAEPDQPYYPALMGLIVDVLKGGAGNAPEGD